MVGTQGLQSFVSPYVFERIIIMEERKIPRHIAIILDGNGRWAKKKGMPRSYGHAAGAKRVEPCVKECDRLGVEYVTMYAFSTENWKRSEDEVSTLMKLLKQYLARCRKIAVENHMKIRIIGDVAGLPKELQEEIEITEDATRSNPGLTFSIALNYGGRDEIIRAVRKLLSDEALRKRIEEEGAESAVDEALISSSLDTAGLPDPDLLIRTSGEERISNFLPWQLCYTEFYFTDTLWPDFSPEEYAEMINAYANRDRRFGGRKE